MQLIETKDWPRNLHIRAVIVIVRGKLISAMSDWWCRSHHSHTSGTIATSATG